MNQDFHSCLKKYIYLPQFLRMYFLHRYKTFADFQFIAMRCEDYDFLLILYATRTNLVIIKGPGLFEPRPRLDFAGELVSAFCSFDLAH